MIRIRNWDKFQHYKTRKPPWIRLYSDLLDDPDFDELSPELVKTLVKLWLAASQFSTDGSLPDIKRLALRMHIDSNVLAKQIVQLNQWVEDDASNMLARCEQDASKMLASETETETETCARARDLSDGDNPAGCTADPHGDTVGISGNSPPSLPIVFTPETETKTISKKKRSDAIKTARVAKGAATWESYSSAYQTRYGTAPVRNAKTNSLCVRLVDALGSDSSPSVAQYYLTSNNALYVSSGHCLELLVRDAQKLRTEWITGKRVTQTKAREDDRLQATGDVWKNVIRHHKEKEKLKNGRGTDQKNSSDV